jgi:hypothetical protein
MCAELHGYGPRWPAYRFTESETRYVCVCVEDVHLFVHSLSLTMKEQQHTVLMFVLYIYIYMQHQERRNRNNNNKRLTFDHKQNAAHLEITTVMELFDVNN